MKAVSYTVATSYSFNSFAILSLHSSRNMPGTLFCVFSFTYVSVYCVCMRAPCTTRSRYSSGKAVTVQISTNRYNAVTSYLDFHGSPDVTMQLQGVVTGR